MKPGDVRDNGYIDVKKEINDKNPKEFLNRRIFFLKGIHQIGQKKYSLLRKLKIQYHGHMLLMILMVKKLLVFLWKWTAKDWSKRIQNRKST